MAVTVKDVMSLRIMKNFKIVAGEKGIFRTVAATEILDFEFLTGNPIKRDRVFNGNSLVLSSFLFAKDQPELILDAVVRLVQLNVHALAYKPVFFEELPEEAIKYAEDHDFPILKFGGDEFFEEIIFSVRNLIEKDQAVGMVEKQLREMVFHDYSEEEVGELYEQLNPSFRKKVVGVCLKDKKNRSEEFSPVLRNMKSENGFISRIFLGRLENKLLIILSQDEVDPEEMQNSFDRILKMFSLERSAIVAGISRLRDLDAGIDGVVKEAYWAERVAEIENQNFKKYSDIGVYRLIAAHYYSKKMIDFMKDYLSPIIKEDGKDDELFRTAVEYILAGGDVVKTGERMFCHKNTIRYRIAKLQEKLDPNVNEKEFYQNLAMAIKIVLLHREL